MSYFTPLNINNDTKKLDEEEENQTRELQVEQGFKIFQEALMFQKGGNFTEAELKYKSLFKLDILKKTDSVTPNMTTLRYLVHKNRGLLRLSKLKKEHSESQKPNLANKQNASEVQGLNDVIDEEVKEEEEQQEAEYLFSQLSLIVQDLTDSLYYSDSDDDTLVETLFELFLYFSSPRLSRILLEYSFTSTESELNLVGINPQFMPPSLNRLLKKFNLILESIYDTNISKTLSRDSTINDRIQSAIQALNVKVEKNLSFFEVLRKQKEKTKNMNLKEIETIELDIPEISFTSLIDHLEETYDNSNRFTKNGFSKSNFNTSLHLHLDPLFSSEFDTTDIVKVIVPEKSSESVEDHDKHEELKVIKKYNIEDGVEIRESDKAEANIILEESDTAATENVLDSAQNKEGNNDINNNLEIQRRSRQRSSKRVKELETQVNFKALQELDVEFLKFNNIFQQIGFKDEVLKNIVRLFLELENKDSSDAKHVKLSNENFRVWIKDFNSSLNNWDRQKSSIILGFKNDASTSSTSFSSHRKKNLCNFSKRVNLENSVMEILKAAIAFDTFADKSNSSMNKSENVEKVKMILSQFINDVNNPKACYNIYELRFLILNAIIGDVKDCTLINEYKFENQENFILNIKKYIDYYEIFIVNNIYKLFVSKSTYEEVETHVNLGLSICEILTDEYISLTGNIRKTENLSNREINEKNNTRNILEARIIQWMGLVNCLADIKAMTTKQWLRLCWCLFLYKQSGGKVVEKFIFGKRITDSILQKEDSQILEELMSYISKLKISINITYCNYTNFPKLNSASLGDFARKTNVLRSFFKIVLGDSYSTSTVNFDADTILPEEASTRSERCIKLLNLILSSSPNIKTMSTDEKFVYNFVQTIPFEFTSKLHEVLLSYYYTKIIDENEYKGGNYKSLFQSNFNRSLSDITNFLNSDSYLELDDSTRQLILLKVLTYFADISDKLVGILKRGNWVCYEDIKSKTILQLVNILGILDIYYLKKACVNSCSYSFPFLETSPRTAHQVENFIVNTYIIFYVFLKRLFSEPESSKQYIDIVSNIHGILGFVGICGNSDGAFLDLLKHELLNVDNIYVDLEIFQLVNCRYHLPLTTEYFKPFDHMTKSIPIDRSSALKFVSTFLKISFEKREPYFNSIKNDLKTILDAMYECIGDPNMKYERIIRADAVLENFLDNSLSPEIFRESFHGLLDLQIQPSRLDIQQAVNNGLYYVQGVMALVLFQIRKRSMQGRSAELDFVIKMFKFDIICGTNRLETWILLGLSYTYLVEDDLIWTADKLNGEKKNTTSILQKKALLCFLMAVSIYSRMNNESRQKSERMIYVLWSSLSKEMYSSIFQPMDKYAYLLSTKPKFLLETHNATATHFGPVIDHPALLETNLLLFQKAAKLKRSDWINYYYISKLQMKLGVDVNFCIQSMLLSCLIAKKYASSYNDVVIEPHYALISMIYEATKVSDIQLSEAIKYIEQDYDFSQFTFHDDLRKQLLDESTSFNDRFKLICNVFIELNRKFLSMDKKKWHHEPRYRIAEIYMNVFKDNKKATEEMSNLVSIKTHNKNLVTIWKPDNERPGMHFVFTYKYVKMYVDLLYSQGHFSSLCLLIKRLRRFGSGMHKMIEMWEYTCHKACTIVRERLDITKTFTDAFLIRSVFKEFVAKSEDLLTKIKDQGAEFLDKNLLLYLYDLSEIRRMNNGFAPTAEIDDTFGAIYLKLYIAYAGDKWDSLDALSFAPEVETEVSSEGTPIPESPSTPTVPKSPGKGGTVKTKVARRDMYPRAISILKILAKQIEELHKKNEFIFDAPEAEAAEQNNHEKTKYSNGEIEADKEEAKETDQKSVDEQDKKHEPLSLPSDEVETQNYKKENSENLIKASPKVAARISQHIKILPGDPKTSGEKSYENTESAKVSTEKSSSYAYNLQKQNDSGIYLASSSSDEENEDGAKATGSILENNSKRKLTAEESTLAKKSCL